MSPPSLLLTNSPSLSKRLRSHSDRFLAKLVRTNYDTQFARTASELAAFRNATPCGVDGIDDATLSDIFRNTVQFTAWDAYSPLLEKFHQKPCKESEVANLLAPGLPNYLVRSSSTSGGTPKLFPKYGRYSGPLKSSSPVPKRTALYLFSFRCNSVDVMDEDACLVKNIYLSSATGVLQRGPLGLHPSKDKEMMATFVSDYAAPFAAGFIKIWRSFLLIQGLFALGNKSLETMNMAFISAFVDLMRHLDAEFDLMVDCIENGTIPDLEGVAEVRDYLKVNITPNPVRAAELRRLGRPSSRPGWCSYAWPNFHSITGIASGSFASYIPLAQWFLGPNANIRAYCYGSSEGMIGFPYHPLELNQFKLNSEIIIEFLDICKSGSINSLVQPWEVEVGNRYEVVMTTTDGLWRYRIGDIVEIAGFDPRDGVPVIRFIERKNVALRFPYFMVTEEELRTAMMSVAKDALGNIADWTTTFDDRTLIPTIGFFVELSGHEVVNSAAARQRLLDILLAQNGMIPWTYEQGLFAKPTVRIVEPGTFSDFRQLKINESPYGMGQVKTPIVLPKASYVAWYSHRVIKEL